MKSAQIGVLVAMCVVFVAVAALLVFLIVRWGRLGRKRLADSLANSAALTDGHVLHFVDMSNTLRSVDIHAMSITDGVSLQSVLATLCGLQDPETISLVYTNEAGCCVEVDLDRLVRPDAELHGRLRRTIEQPLLLTRHEQVLKSPAMPGSEQWAPSVGNARNASDEIEVNYRRDADRLSSKRVRHVGAVRPMSSGGNVPAPLILPRRRHISSTTQVSILAVHYVVESEGTVLDEHATAVVEDAMAGGVQRTVTLPNGEHVAVEPRERAAWLLNNSRSSGTQDGALPLIRKTAEVLQYTIDNMSSAQWYPYRHPFFLPPGRWCVRAESSTFDHRFIETNSRVFTVNVVE
ncbi:hypothetical protein DQ04_03981010 [Trypanosoma grayi]|uniref:hypothetical protein n=1 Tax=Trypanosoma grayi TaxID=71804 RepID=UPI0004F3F72C|nr:hypothetical protein DQ04_03981010 [Trypanosoma grayi]KEG10248.1 hypothetical protein DQ04_03981010 [Trypanosoma grayi]